MVLGVEPRRLALRFSPPSIIVEYARQRAYRTQLYHHEIHLHDVLSSPKHRSSDSMVKEAVDKIMMEHQSVLEHVSPVQIRRLVRKLIDHDEPTATVRDATPIDNAPILPQADYNRVSETQLKQVKTKMDVVFQQNVLRPGDPGYKYDKQVTFQPSGEASDWDD